MRKTRPIRECMSRLPAEIDRQEPLAAAIRLMREQHCHHVPVMDGPRLYGILSRHDLHELALREPESAMKRTAGEVCTRDPLTVAPLTPVVEVAQRMLERGVGSALVTDADMLVGIFTGTDALRLLAQR